MTKITGERFLKRETAARERHRAICIELHPHYCGLRIKGTREFYAAPWAVILDVARKIDARQKGVRI